MTEKPSHSPSPCPAAAVAPPMSWRLRISLLAAGALSDATRRPDGRLSRRLASLLDPHAAANPRPRKGVSSTDITVDSSSSLWFRLFTPTDTAAGAHPIIVFFHGGGFAYFSAASASYDAVCRRICRRTGAVVVSVNYRLSPEHRYPTPYDDGVAVLTFLDSDKLALATSLPVDLSSCFLAGDSAGANIAHHVSRRYVDRQWSRLRLAGVVAIQPFFGGEERTESELRLDGAPLVSMARTDWLWKAFLPAGSDRNHEAANPLAPEAAAAAAESDKFPPVMVVIGGYDPLQDWQKKYYEMLRNKRKNARLVVYPSAIHAFYVFPEFEESGALMQKIKDFVDEFRSKDSLGSN